MLTHCWHNRSPTASGVAENRRAAFGRCPIHCRSQCSSFRRQLVLVLPHHQKHRAWVLASESSMSFKFATKEQNMERNGTAVASKLHTFLGSASTFGHLLDQPQSPTMLCASCLVTTNCFDSVCRFRQQLLDLKLHDIDFRCLCHSVYGHH